MNKQKRLSTLIAAMPKDKQQEAISQINKYQASTSRTSNDHDSLKGTFLERASSSNSILKEDLINTNDVKPIGSESIRTANFIALSNPKSALTQSVITNNNTVQTKDIQMLRKNKFKKTKHQNINNQRSRSTNSRLTSVERPINKTNANNYLQNTHSSTFTGDLASLNSKQSQNSAQKNTSENFK